MKTSHDSKSYLPCSHIVRKASPGEENCRQFVVQATDEGGSICTLHRNVSFNQNGTTRGSFPTYHVFGRCCLIRSALYRGAIRKEQPAYRSARLAYRFPPHQSCAIAALCNKSVPPQATKTSPKSTRIVQSETNLCHVQAGALGGSSGKMREVWREKNPHPKGGFFSLQGLPHFF